MTHILHSKMTCHLFLFDFIVFNSDDMCFSMLTASIDSRIEIKAQKCF